MREKVIRGREEGGKKRREGGRVRGRVSGLYVVLCCIPLSSAVSWLADTSR